MAAKKKVQNQSCDPRDVRETLVELKEALAELKNDPEKNPVVVPKKFRLEIVPTGQEKQYAPREIMRCEGGKYRVISLY